MQLGSLFCFSSAVAVVFCATVQDILDDLSTVRTRTTTLDNAIAAFHAPGSLFAALVIHTDATNIRSAIDTTTTDAKTIPALSVADGTLVLNSVNAIKIIILDALSQVVTKKSAFDALPVGGASRFIRQDLSNLRASAIALENALIAVTPSALLAQAQNVKAEIDAAFAKAVAAYA